MKLKTLSIIILMTTFIIILSTKAYGTTEIIENNKYKIEQETSIKILPLINCKEKAKISGEITILEIINDWARIENNTNDGWIRKNILKNLITSENTPTQEESNQEETTQNQEQNNQDQENQQPEASETNKTENTQKDSEPVEEKINKTGYVNAEGLVVRAEPTTESKELDILSRNKKLEIIGQIGKWYKIKLNGEIGYVSAKYVSDKKTAETTSRGGTTLKKEPTETNQQTVSQEQETTKTEQVTQSETNITTQEPPKIENNITGAEVVEYAKKYLGYKYVSGGTLPSTGFDCSGFTQYVYKNFGITLNRKSSSQKNNGVSVDKSNLQLGDIVLFNNDANTKIGHVGIYVGDGNFIHASNPQDGVKITTLLSGYYQKRYVGARRVI